MTFSESVRTCLREKYVTFSGRASRSEYWWFQLFVMLVWIGLILIMFAAGAATSAQTGEMSGALMVALVLAGIVMLGLMLPIISVVVRRFHDYNLSGWWYLAAVVAGFIPFVGFLASIAVLVIMCLKGTAGTNKFGPDPLGASDADIFS